MNSPRRYLAMLTILLRVFSRSLAILSSTIDANRQMRIFLCYGNASDHSPLILILFVFIIVQHRNIECQCSSVQIAYHVLCTYSDTLVSWCCFIGCVCLQVHKKEVPRGVSSLGKRFSHRGMILVLIRSELISSFSKSCVA